MSAQQFKKARKQEQKRGRHWKIITEYLIGTKALRRRGP